MGQNKVTFWDRRSCLMVITSEMLGLNKVIFLGQEKSILGLNKMNYGT